VSRDRVDADAFSQNFFRFMGGIQNFEANKTQQANIAEDRATRAEDRSRNIRLQDTALAQAGEDRSRQHQREDASDAQRNTLFQRSLKDADYVDSIRETPDEVRAGRDLDRQGKKLTLAAAGTQLQSAKETLADQRATRAQREALPVLREVTALMDGGQELGDDHLKRLDGALGAFGTSIASLTGDDYGKAEVTLRDAIKAGKVTDPATLPAWNTVFRDRLNRTAGEKLEKPIQRGRITLPAGTEILDRELVGVKPEKDGVYGVVQVKYRTPEGKEGAYLAPITKDRSANDDDKPMLLKYDDVMKQFTGRNMLRKALTADPAMKTRMQAFVQSQMPTSATTAGRSSELTLLDSLTERYAGGDQAKGIALYERIKQMGQKRDTPESIKAGLAEEMIKASAGMKINPQQIRADVEALYGAIYPDGSAGPAGGAPPPGGDTGAEDYSSLWGGQ
jgi:hypothetical protein